MLDSSELDGLRLRRISFLLAYKLSCRSGWWGEVAAFRASSRAAMRL